MYVEWSWDLRATEARNRLTSAVAAGEARDVYRAVLERLETSSSFGLVYASILGHLEPVDRQLLSDALRARGSQLFDIDGRQVGWLDAVFVDRETGRPQWLAVSYERDGRNMRVGLPAAALATVGVGAADASLPLGEIRAAPALDVEFVSANNEHELCRHYGLAPTRGAAARGVERRATCSQAFPPKPAGECVRWLPGPRELGNSRAGNGGWRSIAPGT